MDSLILRSFHEARGARFVPVGGCEVVGAYGAVEKEYAALAGSAAVLDLSFRGRLCLTGADRLRFLNGQVTNAVKDLQSGQGCYAALVTEKGRLVSDLNIFCLRDELLLDFEPGCATAVRERLEKFVIADDVQVVDVAPHYGLLSVQGPKASAVVSALGPGLGSGLPEPGRLFQIDDPSYGEVCCAYQSRGTAPGYDLFVPNSALEAAARALVAAAENVGGGQAGWEAMEMVRIEAGLPRFGQDMDGTNLAPEAGIEGRAISYSKGCYIGQEVIARIRTYGQVSKALRGMILSDDLPSLPAKGAALVHDGKDVGYITSAVRSLAVGRNIALGYVRRECNGIGTDLALRMAGATWPVKIVAIPFAKT